MKKFFFSVFLVLNLPICIFSQIMYNVSKPFSYDKSGLKNITELPQIHFPVNNDGNLIEQNLKLNIKEKAVNEIIDNKFVTRMKVKVFAEKLGMMTLILDNVKLNNNSYCYVYTPDYKIVAGPVYQGSIDKYLIIKEIPTDELIIEVISNFTSDFDLSIDEVDYLTKFKDKKTHISNNKIELLGRMDSCYACNYGNIDHADNTFWIDTNNIQTESNCNWLGAGVDNSFFERKNFVSINDYQLPISRSSCIIMAPVEDSDTSLPSYINVFPFYQGINGTLINFPYSGCDSNDCGSDIIISDYHQGVAQKIVLKSTGELDLDYLNKVIVRFNAHHKNGIPWHLENVQCWASEDNFNKWRETIDFSEVIDYCGVRAIVYEDVIDQNGHQIDFVLYKMLQKTFYKELHLGWSTQNKFDKILPSPATEFENSRNDFLFMGRRGSMPTQLIIPLKDTIPYFDFRYYLKSRDDGSSADTNFTGYSSSLLLNQGPQNAGWIGIGLIVSGDTKYINCQSFYDLFNYDGLFNYLDRCKPINKILDYINNNYPSFLNFHNFSYIKNFNQNPFSPIYDTSSYYWVPSINNKDKCASQLFAEDDCDFNINDYVNWDANSNCLTIESIPYELFPGGVLPKGYRIYHNYSDKKTLNFDQFNDGIEISLPFSHCFSLCELIELFLDGRDSINLAIDFYDENGNVFNSEACQRIRINLPINLNLCDYFNVITTRIESSFFSCKYKVELQLNSCFENNSLLYKFSDSLKFYSLFTNTMQNVKSLDNVEFDYEQALLSFEYSISEPITNKQTSLQFYYGNRKISCTTDTIDFAACKCECPKESEVSSWVTTIVSPGTSESSCPVNFCEVEYKINIPSYYGCFTRIKFNQSHFITLVDNKLTYKYCIPKGEVVVDTFRFFKGYYDDEFCIIKLENFCPLYDEPQACTPDCDSIPWSDRNLELTLPDCPDCKVEASYKTRKNTCNDSLKQEIQVTKFSTYSISGDTLACNNCNTDEEIHAMIIKKAILDNQMGFEPATGSASGNCYTNWRVVMSSCWIEYLSNSQGLLESAKLVRQPCDSSTCCSIGLRVCRYSGPPIYVSLETIGGSAGEDSCNFSQIAFIYYESPKIYTDGTVSVGYLDTFPCIEKCSWLLGINDSSFYGKRIVEEIPNNQIMIGDNCKLLTYLDNEKIECILNNESESKNCVIRIFSLTGQSVLVVAKTIHKGINNFDLNVGELLNGLYYIQAEINGVCSKFDKLIIVR